MPRRSPAPDTTQIADSTSWGPAIPTTPTRGRGRPRDETMTLIARQAARDLLREHGPGAVTLLAVSERSDLNRNTLRVRWQGYDELVRAALWDLMEGLDDPLPDTGTLNGDLMALMMGEHERLAWPPRRELVAQGVPLAGSTRWPKAAEAWRQGVFGRIESGVRVAFERAAGRGETVEADPGAVVGALTGTLLAEIAGGPKMDVARSVAVVLGRAPAAPKRRGKGVRTAS